MNTPPTPTPWTNVRGAHCYLSCNKGPVSNRYSVCKQFQQSSRGKIVERAGSGRAESRLCQHSDARHNRNSRIQRKRIAQGGLMEAEVFRLLWKLKELDDCGRKCGQIRIIRRTPGKRWVGEGGCSRRILCESQDNYIFILSNSTLNGAVSSVTTPLSLFLWLLEQLT